MSETTQTETKVPRTKARANDSRRALSNFARFDYCMSRGHRDYLTQADICERFYLGAGLQWDADARAEMEESERRPAEQNEIMQMVNTAIGYQIANRMDISVRPRGRGADDKSAEVFTKVIKQVADNTKLHWRETEVFADGMIRQRGYYDVRMSFETNAYGEIDLSTHHPSDVIPDPDSHSYDPNDWGDVTINRYYTLDQIEQNFGRKARRAVEMQDSAGSEANNDTDGMVQNRSRFGMNAIGDFAYYSEIGDVAATILYRVIDRQYRVYEPTLCAVFINGDIRPIPFATPEQVRAYKNDGALITKRMQRRVKWLVTTMSTVLFDDHSPYPWFTIVPFFPYFRHGQTRGLVDNAISIQESVNKGIAGIGCILNSVANTGFTVEQQSLTNMSIDEFKRDAAKNGLVLEYKRGSKPPARLPPPQVPGGIFEYVNMQVSALKNSTGMDEALTASGPIGDQSGVAYQARQYAAQQKLAVPLDNLARTRHMLAQRFIDLIQMFMDAPQVLRIIETDPFGKETSVELPVNQPQAGSDGLIQWLNDLTAGEYDLVISEQPMQITFDNSQFEQLRALVEMGYTVPIGYAIRYSNLSEKSELAQAIEEASQQKPDPEVEAKVQLLLEQAAKTRAETSNKRIEAVYGATQAGAQIASIPQVASLADEILQSAGFEDQNSAPIIPQGGIGAGLTAAAPAAPTIAPTNDGMDPGDANTNPLTPENPGVGMHEGIEAMGVQ